MSKSYKKYYLIRQEKEDYHYLNRQIRRDKLAEIPNGGAYRRHRPHFNTWAYRWTWEDAKKEYYEYRFIHNKYTIEQWYNYWASCVKRK